MTPKEMLRFLQNVANGKFKVSAAFKALMDTHIGEFMLFPAETQAILITLGRDIRTTKCPVSTTNQEDSNVQSGGNAEQGPEGEADEEGVQ